MGTAEVTKEWHILERSAVPESARRTAGLENRLNRDWSARGTNVSGREYHPVPPGLSPFTQAIVLRGRSTDLAELWLGAMSRRTAAWYAVHGDCLSGYRTANSRKRCGQAQRRAERKGMRRAGLMLELFRLARSPFWPCAWRCIPLHS